MTQYSEYGSVSSSHLNLFYSKLKIFDRYVIFRTGDQTYSMLVENIPTGQVTQYDISRSSNYGSTYTLTSFDRSEFDYTISNEYYVYSNDGVGTMQLLPCHSITLTFAVCGILSLLFIKQFFGRLFFKK